MTYGGGISAFCTAGEKQHRFGAFMKHVIDCISFDFDTLLD